MHIVGFADNQVSLDWLDTTVRDKWKAEIKSKNSVVPGQIPIEDKFPESEITIYVPLPVFKVLVVNGRPVKHPGSQEQGQCLPSEVQVQFRVMGTTVMISVSKLHVHGEPVTWPAKCDTHAMHYGLGSQCAGCHSKFDEAVDCRLNLLETRTAFWNG